MSIKRNKQAIKRERRFKRRRLNFSALKWMCFGVVLGVSGFFILPYVMSSSLLKQAQSFTPSFFASSHKAAAREAKATKKSMPPKQSAPPSFDFYTLLPEMQVEVPAKEPATKLVAAPTVPVAKPELQTPTPASLPALAVVNKPQVKETVAVKTVPAAEKEKIAVATPTRTLRPSFAHYTLQIGVFKNFSDADAAKTQLLVSGFPVHMQSFTTKDGKMAHRIKMGTYKNKDIAQRDRQRLMAMNYKQTVILTEE